MMLVSPYASTFLKIKISDPFGSAKVYENPQRKNKGVTSNFLRLRDLKMNPSRKTTKVYSKN